MTTGLFTNEELIDTLLADLANLPNLIVNGQHLVFQKTIETMRQKLVSLKKGVVQDLEAKDQTIEEFKRQLKIARVNLVEMTPQEFCDMPKGAIRMKQGLYIQAYKALSKIMTQDTSLAVSKKVFDLHEKLKPIWDFQVNEELKIAGRYPLVDIKTITVKYDPNDKEAEKKALAELDAFEKELKELTELDVEIEVIPFTINVEKENIRLSGNDVKALNGFVNFE